MYEKCRPNVMIHVISYVVRFFRHSHVLIRNPNKEDVNEAILFEYSRKIQAIIPKIDNTILLNIISMQVSYHNALQTSFRIKLFPLQPDVLQYTRKTEIPISRL